ncbi:MAG: glycoside hydrolase family 130 protein [Planctomycetota bacterium]
MNKLSGEYTICPVVRHPENPLLAPSDVPYDCSLLFNAGVCKYRGAYTMVFRNDYGPDRVDFEGGERFAGTNLGLATSDDGVSWSIKDRPCITIEQARDLIAPLIPHHDPQHEIGRFYDPRLTVLEDRIYMCFAIDTAHGLRGGVAVTDDFENWEVLSASVPDNRNMVLFPQKINGRFVRLERPVNCFGGNHLHGSQAMMWLSYSPDLKHWGDSQPLLTSAEVDWANDKLGPAAPPVLTDQGWLATFHAVWREDPGIKNGWEPVWPKRYAAGIMLLDRDDPSKVLGRCPCPLLTPEAWYETGRDLPPDIDPGFGFRRDVIFPGGMILEPDGEVKIYYGAADTVECLATASVDQLVDACLHDEQSV